MSTTGERLVSERKRRGLSQQELADLADVSQTFIAKVESDAHKRHIPREIIKVAIALKMNVADLAVSLPQFRRDSYAAEQEIMIASATKRPGNPTTMANAVIVPEIDVRAGAGGGGIAITDFEYNESGEIREVERISETWTLPSTFVRQELRADPKSTIMVEVLGDSMSPKIESGDRVIVDRRFSFPSPDGIYLIHDGYGLMVKRLQIKREESHDRDTVVVEVISDNPSHGAWDMHLGDGQPGRVIGMVVGRITRV